MGDIEHGVGAGGSAGTGLATSGEPSSEAAKHLSAEEIRAKGDQFLFPGELRLYLDPLPLVKGQGTWVTDASGQEYLDLFSGILTTSVGHCHPEVIAAVHEQMSRLGHTSTLYLTENETEMAERLAHMAPGRLTRTFFTNSGTEAVETAIQLARVHTGRSEILALRQAYHGRSALASDLTGVAAWRPLPASTAGISHVKAPYPYRCPFKQPCDESCSEAFANELEEAIVTSTSGKPAAFIVETIQGVGGYIVPPHTYFERVAEIIRRYGGLLIVDEVQAGFGRTGDYWFGIDHWHVEPDIMVMAKGIANGMPVGATMTRTEIAQSYTAKNISTFGGNPVAMAAAIATNDVMQREDVRLRASERGEQLRTGLLALSEDYPWIGEVRGMGLMQAIELVEDRKGKKPAPRLARRLMEAARVEGLLLGLGGTDGHAIRIGPSLLISEEEIAEGLTRLGRACAAVQV
jgi:4-aminobutyrate aminotransferase